MNKNLVFYDLDLTEHTPNENDEVTFRPGVYPIVINDKNQILMILDEKSNQWEIPGGGINIGEDLVQAAIREAKEETGYDIDIKDEMPLYIENDLAYYRRTHRFVHAINFYMMGSLKSAVRGNQNFDEGENILEVRFFEIYELKNLDIVYFQRKIVEKIVASYSSSN